MAAPPGNDPQIYSPSKLTELPDTYLTPSNDSLNNSGVYAPATQGPITASGHGPPARRDGQAYWNNNAPTPQPILISSSPPAAGRSPQDSIMGPPESEEPTLPAILTTQVGQATQDTIMAALPTAPTDSQQLWDNVPTLPTYLPPLPEVIKVKGRTTPTANKTPRPRLRALSNASIWSHATVESNVSDAAEPSIPPTAANTNLTFKWHTLGAAIQAGFLADPMDPNAVPMSAYNPDGDESDFLAELNQTLESEIHQDVSAVLQGWSTYQLLHSVELWKGHDLPTTTNEFNCMVSAVLTALDVGAASHNGEMMVKGLTPQSWMRLTMATLSTILRGALRSPSALRSGSRSLNGVDSFPIHNDLDRPLTEGGAIMLMCQQLGGLYASLRNHPDRSYPDSYFDRLTTLLDSKMHMVPTPAAPLTHPPLTEGDRVQIDVAARERLILQGIEALRLNQPAMAEIKDAVKAEIFANMNTEALQNIDDWRALYKHEFTEAMHLAFEAQYPGIHPNKGKARADPPITHSQVVRNAQPHIQQEVKLQVEARIAGIHTEIKESLANNDPFWTEGPLRDAIANELRTKTQADVQRGLEQDIQALRVTSAAELDAFKAQLQYDQDLAHQELHAQARAEYDQAKKLFATNLEADLQDFRTAIEACRFGYNIVPIDAGSTAAEKAAFAKYALPPIEVDGHDISVELTTMPFPAQTPFLTPDNLPHALPDPNITPTPTRVKRIRMEELAAYPPITEGLFLPVSSPTPTPHAVAVPLPPSLPMEEDLDYALEVVTDHLHETKPGLSASIHASTSDTNHSSWVHNPSAPPQGAACDALSGQQPMDPIPVTLKISTTKLEELTGPPRGPDDNLAAILAAINATILRLEGRLTERLDVQDKRIAALSVLTAPTPVPHPPPVNRKRAKGEVPVTAAPHPNTPSTPSEAREMQAPVPCIDDPTPHDRVEEIHTPGTQAMAQGPTPEQPTVLREAFQPPPDKHVRLNVDAHGKPTPATSMPPSWANVVTKKATAQQIQGAGQAKAVTAGTHRSGTGKAHPETVAQRKQTGNTEATVIRHHGLEDIAFEMTIWKMTPASIINETRTKVDRLTRGKVVLLSGRWSSNLIKTIHNFIYTFKGQVPFKTLYPLRDVLVKPLMTGHLVPNDGWTFAQLRDTTTSGPDRVVYSSSQLEDELRRNLAFEDAIFCIAPHWQGSMHKVSTNPKGTVKFAYVDEDGKIMAQAKQDSVFLFNEKTRFVPTGDVARIILCGRCHRIGHATDSTACPLPSNGVRCFICGGAHHSNNHAAHCPNQHDKVGECRCLFPCINCGRGHNARSPHCKLKMGFSPPDLAPPPTPAAPAAPSAKGKAKAAPSEDLTTTQREPTSAGAEDETQQPFTMVTHKPGRKAKFSAAKCHARNQANASVPGSSSANELGIRSKPPPPSTATPPAPPTATNKPPGKLTSKVPARPIYTLPTPPSWKEAPVIHKQHVATDLECAAALRRIFKHEPTADDLRSLHVAWGGHELDEEATALWTLHFRWAVKYGLLLTTNAARARIVNSNEAKVEELLKRFEEDWGPPGPRTYLLSTIPQEQYFAHPGDLEEVVITPKAAAHNCNMACTLVQTVLKFKRLEATANNTAPPPTITEPIIEALLDAYSFNGTYSFFGLTSAGTDDTIWEALIDMHAMSTSALLAYA
ncbi:hypothetical protein EDB86DRAFT_3076598 [Lactarius hatsudake]|nr:hypothetical protein EDB86DRAFT_3076598 [Lactarius hatsudake]